MFNNFLGRQQPIDLSRPSSNPRSAQYMRSSSKSRGPPPQNRGGALGGLVAMCGNTKGVDASNAPDDVVTTTTTSERPTHNTSSSRLPSFPTSFVKPTPPPYWCPIERPGLAYQHEASSIPLMIMQQRSSSYGDMHFDYNPTSTSNYPNYFSHVLPAADSMKMAAHQANPVHLMGLPEVGTFCIEYIDQPGFLGRAGLLRFYLLAKGIDHKFTLIRPDLIRSPTADYPTVRPTLTHERRISVGGGGNAMQCRKLSETMAACRYVARLLKDYGNDNSSMYNDYFADMAIEKLAYWLDDLMSAIMTARNRLYSSKDNVYMTLRQDHYTMLEELLARGAGGSDHESMRLASFGSIARVGSGVEGITINWVDCAVAAVIQDDLQLMAYLKKTDQVTEGGRDIYALNRCPSLYRLYTHVCTLKGVSELLKNLDAALRRDVDSMVKDEHTPHRKRAEEDTEGVRHEAPPSIHEGYTTSARQDTANDHDNENALQQDSPVDALEELKPVASLHAL